jgi:integrase/recombinase XerD
MYVRDPSRVVVTGPLAPYAAGFCAELGQRGYAWVSAAELMQLLAHLSRWLGSEHLGPAGLTAEVVERFLVDRRERYRRRLTENALRPLLAYLRDAGVAPWPARQDNDTGVPGLLEEYRQYLVRERGLAASSIRRYMPAAGLFVSAVVSPAPAAMGLEQLSARHVMQFVLGEASRRNTPDAKSLVTALRSLLRFLFVTGKIPNDLVLSVPTVANRKLSTLPGRLEAGQVDILLGACDRDTAAGRRDFAVLTVLARLGLRAGEAAAIEVGDVGWRAGELTVRGKGGRRDRLPLPADVGQALADYLLRGRPAGCPATRLFISECAPRQAISACAVRAIVARACARTGMPRIGAHRLRHTVASDLLHAGAPLPEIGQVLRHRSQLSTATYAKVDRDRLRALARPWPGGAA